MADTPPPIRAGPTAKERKYDRQLRLWAASGQAALEDAHVLLIQGPGPGVAGIETLKNLVLPGIGHFTVQDAAQVVDADLGVNFFLEDDDVGKLRGERTAAWLQELNPDVKGHAITEPLETFLDNPDALKPYTFIILTLPTSPDLQQIIIDHCSATQTPAFHLHCAGFYGHFTAHLPDAFPIVDTHPDPAATTDLRLLEPWPELAALAAGKTANMDAMDAEEHGHVPYVLLLLHHLEKWKASHDGQPPTTYKDKTAFREQVRNAARSDGPEGFEENYEEAVNAVLKTLNPHTPSSAVRQVFTAPECQHPTGASPSFWRIAHAVAAFYANTGALPLSGALPDMKAKSADYIELQNAYKSKARADVASVTAAVRALESSLSTANPAPDAEIAAFCKAAAHIKLLRGRAPQVARPGALPAFNDRAAPLAAALADETSLLPLYIALLAHDSYAASHGGATGPATGSAGPAAGPSPRVGSARPPASDSALASATSKTSTMATTLIDSLLKEGGAHLDSPDYAAVQGRTAAFCAEIARARGGQMHNVAAVVGGVAAQEAIKVVTGQYVPVDNCFLWDGVGSRTEVLRV